MLLTVLGSGSSKPIPRDDNCKQCRSRDPRDRRWPSALLVDGNFLIDCPTQILDLLRSIGVQPRQIHAVLTTHRHEDASGGLHLFTPPMCENLKISAIDFPIPHGRTKAKGYLIDDVVYCSDCSDIRPALPYLKKARVAFLDGSGWDRVFPSHQPMIEVIPVVKRLQNLRKIYFTHNGHTHIPHRKLEKMVQSLGDRRFKLAYHGMKIKI